MGKGSAERLPDPTEDFATTAEEAAYATVDQSPGEEAAVPAAGAEEEEMPPKADQAIDSRPLAQRFSEGD